MTAGALRVGIDYRTALRPNPTGVGRYVRDLVAALSAQGGPWRYILLHDRGGAHLPGGPHLDGRATRLPVLRSTAVRAVWEEVWLPAVGVHLGLDVYHGPNALLPFFLPHRIAAVVTVHDLVFRALPATLGAVHLARLRTSAAYSLRRADAVIAESAHTARDLQRYFGLAADAVSVIHPGVDASFRPLPTDEARRLVAARFGLTRPYILSVGGLGARKNVATIVRAYIRLRQEWRAELDLVLAGDTNDAGNVLDIIRSSGLRSAIHLPGFVTDNDLAPLYSAATMFVYPSLYEGFGLPVLEAMSCGAPVICAAASSLPEVVGSAGLLVQPRAVDDWVRAVRSVVESPARQAELRAAGLRQAGRFSLGAEAAASAEVYAAAYRRAGQHRAASGRPYAIGDSSPLRDGRPGGRLAS